jgi:cytochrome c oxidase subunit IV
MRHLIPVQAIPLGLIAAVGAMTWTAVATILPIQLPPPEATLIALSALASRAFASLALTRFASRRPDGAAHGWVESFGTALVGMSLSYTVGIAVLKGVFTKHEPFKVTSKGKKKRSARFPALPEAILTVALLTSAGTAAWMNHADTLALHLWSVLMMTMALPNLVATFLAAGDMLPVREARPQDVPAASPTVSVGNIVSA